MRRDASLLPLVQARSPARVVRGEQRGGPGAVVGVAAAALLLDLAEDVAEDFVAAGEDGPVRAELVEARPQRWGGRDRRRRAGRACRRVPVNSSSRRPAIATALNQATAASTAATISGDGRSMAIRKRHDADAFAAGERRRFVVAGPGRCERPLVVLRAPGREPAALLHLGAQDDVDAAGDGSAGFFPAAGVDEGIGRLAGGDIAQQPSARGPSRCR